MPFPTLAAKLIAYFRRVIIANELENNLAFALKFSDPDGERSGKSGWSFGVCQFDLQNNPRAALCLKACGFTDLEISGLIHQTIDPEPLEPKLVANKAVIEAFDEAQLRGCLERTLRIALAHQITLADDTATLAIADYDNQYHLSNLDQPGYLVHFLKRLGREATAEDILEFKLHHTKYGAKRPADCRRRHANIIKIMRGNA